MILGLDISTSIIGAAVLDSDGNHVIDDSWDIRKYKDFFQKACVIEDKIGELQFELQPRKVDKIFIEQPLMFLSSGMTTARTITTLSKFNGMISWMAYKMFDLVPEYVEASTARRMCGIKVPRGVKAKQCVMEYLLDNEPKFHVEYTRHGNPRPEAFDRADAIIIAKAGYSIWQNEKSSDSSPTS